MNVNLAKIIEENNGELPHHTSIGGYPLYYVTSDNRVLCPDCANAIIKGTADEYVDIEADDIVAMEVNWDNVDLYCDLDSDYIDCATIEVDDNQEDDDIEVDDIDE